ncbi:MAG TPA: RluA family pseudouridine synthase [Candidatus Binatia bacterium]|nr:RluA family pseudouridine synthase [Candidatus Binatia bacterium]
MRLYERLQALYPGASHRRLKQWLEASRIRVNGAIVRRGDLAVGVEDRVELIAAPPPACPPPLRLVHEDEDILVVDKPSGLLTIATEREREHTAYRLLREWVSGRGPASARLFIVHRLDRETSGLIVFAKSAAAKERLQAQFAARAVERVYVALAEGVMRQGEGTLVSRLIEDPALRVRTTDRRAGREAITRYRVLERRRAETLLELQLVTGRRAQIRAQLAAAGHPIAGDREYGGRTDPLRRLALHATRLAFVHPRGGRVSFDSPLPAAFGRRPA